MTSLGVPQAHLLGERCVPSAREQGGGGGEESGANGKSPFGVVTDHEILEDLAFLAPWGLI